MESGQKVDSAEVHLDDGVDRDWLLQQLVTHANQTKNQNLPITLWLGGGLVSGTLVSGAQYMDAFTEEIIGNVHEDDREAVRRNFRELGKKYYEPEENPWATDTMFVHLVDARFWSPSGCTPSAGKNGVIWRGRLSAISGFNLGKMIIG